MLKNISYAASCNQDRHRAQDPGTTHEQLITISESRHGPIETRTGVQKQLPRNSCPARGETPNERALASSQKPTEIQVPRRVVGAEVARIISSGRCPDLLRLRRSYRRSPGVPRQRL
jgi:hypothetical protein